MMHVQKVSPFAESQNILVSLCKLLTESEVRDRNQTMSSATFSRDSAQRASPQEACEGLSRHKRTDTVQTSSFNQRACEMTGRSDVNVTKLS